MKRAIHIILILVCALTAKAQSYSEIVELVKSNVHLKAARAARDAAKSDAATGLTLANPEVELGYQLGYPRETVPNRTQITVKQELDMATLTGAKRNVAQQASHLLDAQCDAAEWQAVIEAHQVLVELTACNIRLNEMERRSMLAKQLADACKKAAEHGTATAIDANKSLVAWQTAEAERLSAVMERDIAKTRLEEMCGTEITFTDTVYQQISLPADFEQWFDEHSQDLPQLAAATQSIALAKGKQRLTRMESLPSLTVGYASELVRGNNYHGAVVGLSLPLWANKGKKHAAEAAVIQAAEENRSEKVRLHSEYKQQYIRAVQYRNIAMQCRTTLDEHNSELLLLRKLADNNMSLIDYIAELENFYDLIDRLHESEREAALAAVVFQV